MPPWKYVNPLPTPRSQLAAATYNAPAPQSGVWIYAIGGADTATNSVFATVEAYDTATNSWSSTPPINPMHTARWRLAAASGPDGLHALGGADASGTVLATHEIYDPATNVWSPAKSMPTARAQLAAATGPGPDGLIYAIGGYDADGNSLGTVEAYDPIKGAWSSPPPSPMSTPRAFHAAVTGLDGLIYAIGGYNSEGPVSTVEAYDPALNQWHTKALTFTGQALAAAVDPKGLIYAIGGVDSTGAMQASVYSYDPAHPAAAWTEQYPLQTARDGLAAATGPDGLIYAIGGVGEPPLLHEVGLTLGTVEAYTPGPPPPPPNPCAAIAAQLESFNEADWENPQAALAGLRGLVSALRECMQQHGGWPVIRG
jgi:hypothetical protein